MMRLDIFEGFFDAFDVALGGSVTERKTDEGR